MTPLDAVLPSGGGSEVMDTQVQLHTHTDCDSALQLNNV